VQTLWKQQPLLDSTGGRILQVETLNDVDSNYEDSRGEDSKLDENFEICKLEKLDLDDKDGI
jgi:hypothetical protein